MNYPSQNGQDQHDNDSEEQHRVLAQEKPRFVSRNKAFLVMRVAAWRSSTMEIAGADDTDGKPKG